MSGSTTRQHRSRFRWIVPAVIGAILFLGGVAGNLVAADLDPVRKQYPGWVWAFFFVAGVIAVFVAVREYNKQDKSPEPQDEPPPKSKSSHAPRHTIVDGEVEDGTLIVRIPTPVNALHQLPPPPRDFTGRVRELEELMSKIERGGVTISGLQGLGGVGKTVLALKLAEHLAPRYPDAQFYLDLKGADKQPLSVVEVLSHVIRAYHPTAKLPESEAELRAQYLSLLHGRNALLLMDNASGREQVEPLVPPEGCVLLVTSRVHFTLPGLYAKKLDTLSPEESRELLLKIAPRIGDSADEIARLCSYLPLALRLAASALAERDNLSPADYARRLSDAQKRLELVDASLTLSHELLSPEQQKLWRTLGVFPDTFDAAAAAAVWELDADATQDALGELVRYSLLNWDASTRRYRLHDLTRLFADSRMSDDEAHATRTRHAAHYLKVLKECDELYLKGGDAIKSGLALFDVERRNIEAGQEWASEIFGESEVAAQACKEYPGAGAYVLHIRQYPRESIRWLEVALEAAHRAKDKYFEGGNLGYLGLAYAYVGETRRAIECNEQALSILREVGDHLGEANVLGNLGNVYAELGDTHRATEIFEQALDIFREVKDRRGESGALSCLGNSHVELGEPRLAIKFYEQALDISRELGDRQAESQDLGNLGNAYKDLGEPQRAVGFCEQQLVITREIGDRRGEEEALNKLGNAYKALGETHRAVEFYKLALVIAREIDDRRGEANVLFNTSLALDALRDRANAIAYAEAALEIYKQIESQFTEKVRAQLTQWRGNA